MGQQETKQLGVYPSNYSFIKEVFQYPYGQGRVLQSYATKDQIFQITIDSYNKNEIRSFCQQLQNTQRQYKGDFILQLLNWNEEQTGLILSNYHKVSLFYEYCPKTLAEEIEFKKKQNERFSQAEIVYLLYAIVSVCYHLQLSSTSHKDLRPANILLAKNSVKIAPVGTFPYDLDALKKQTSFNQFVYISPELQLAQSSDWQSCDAYAAGLTLLDSISLTFSYDIIEINSKQERQKLLFKKLGSAAQYYDFGLLRIISKLVEYDSSQRLNFSEIYNFLHPKRNKILNLEPIDLPKQRLERMVISPIRTQQGSPINLNRITPQNIGTPNQKMSIITNSQNTTLTSNKLKQVSPNPKLYKQVALKQLLNTPIKKVQYIRNDPESKSIGRSKQMLYQRSRNVSPTTTQCSVNGPTLQITTQHSPSKTSYIFLRTPCKGPSETTEQISSSCNENSVLYPKFTIKQDGRSRLQSVEIETQEMIQVFDHQQKVNYKKLKEKLEILNGSKKSVLFDNSLALTNRQRAGSSWIIRNE